MKSLLKRKVLSKLSLQTYFSKYIEGLETDFPQFIIEGQVHFLELEKRIERFDKLLGMGDHGGYLNYLYD